MSFFSFFYVVGIDLNKEGITTVFCSVPCIQTAQVGIDLNKEGITTADISVVAVP